MTPRITSLATFSITLCSMALAGPLKQPNILWIITDDHRPDSVRAYNEAVYGRQESPLGYVESPNIDRLAAEGVLFTNANCNSPVCGPSRGSMHSGRYPFRNGHYSFEVTHQNPDFVRPVVSQTMRDHGYGTATFGKDDHYIFRWGPGQGFHDGGFFDLRSQFKSDLQKYGFGDIFSDNVYGKVDGQTKVVGQKEFVHYADGSQKSFFIERAKGTGPISAEDRAARAEMDQTFDILRCTGNNKNLIYGGVNPRPAGETVDGFIVKEFKDYLANADQSFNLLRGKKAQGADTNQPQFIHLGFHLPHTPVLPPKSFRERFKTKQYKLPAFDPSEVEKLPKQLQVVYEAMRWDGFTDAQQQQAIQDYYAFCAYGDSLIGEAVDAFKKYCAQNQQEYLIVFTIGDHGWHLGEQGIEAKFGPWKQSTANAAIVVSSDKSLVPAGGRYDDFIEFVDFAPTMMAAGGIDIQLPEMDYLDGYSLFDVLNEKLPKREYVLGEINLVGGPRAYLHTDRFRFSMRTRPFNVRPAGKLVGKDVKWALTVPVEEVDLALYDLQHDPLERNNVANDPEYRELADWFRRKLGNIVLGDGRVECDWAKANAYVLSDFAKGADDKQLNIPTSLIP